MAKVTIIQQVYKSRRFVPQVYDAMAAQTFADAKIISQIVDDEEGSKEYIKLHYPQVKILEPGYNIGFARGHNEIFAASDSEYFQLVNPDLITKPDFVENMLKIFEDPAVGVVSGKLMHYDFVQNQPTQYIDSTGVTMTRGGRGRDRGQHEIDKGQYDNQLNILGASGAGMMVSKKALNAVKFKGEDGRWQYFDESFHSYWEDVDLSWRVFNAGFKCIYAPTAVGYHGRAAASSSGGYWHFWSFLKHHRKINPRIRQLNFRNHFYLYIKNSPKLYWQFFARELFMWIYVLLFETATFKALPELIRTLPSVWQKRKSIQGNRKTSTADIEKLFVK